MIVNNEFAKKVIIAFITLVACICGAIGTMTVFNVRDNFAVALNEKAMGDINMSLALIDSKYPGEWSLKDGVLFKGNIQLNNNFELVDNLAKLNNNHVTIFAGDTRIATTVVVEGKRAVGTKAAGNVVETVLQQGEIYKGIANVVGVNYQAVYSPLKNANGDKIGMLYMGISKEFADNLERTFIIYLILAIILSLVIGSVLAWCLSGKVLTPIVTMANAVDKIAKGDLRIDKIYYNRQDEIGTLANGINSMVKALKDLVGQINLSAQEVSLSGETITTSVNESAEAGEQTATSIMHIASSANSQVELMDKMTENVNNMLSDIRVIEQSSVNVNNIAEETVKTTQDGQNNINQALNQMKNIEQGANAVEGAINNLANGSKEISEIVTMIRGIAGQTNLLALNAAIEAARAGQMGRGFAVVADEVRKLAEESNQATHRISELINHNEQDMNAVITVSKQNVQGVVQGMNVVQTAGTSFGEIAQEVKILIEEIKNIGLLINKISQGSECVAEEINKVTEFSNEMAGDTQSVSAASEEQSATMKEIAYSIGALNDVTAKLNAAVNYFKIK